MNLKNLKALITFLCLWLISSVSFAQTVKIPSNFRQTVQSEYSKMVKPELSFDDYFEYRKTEYVVLNSAKRTSEGNGSNTTICGGGDFETNQITTADWYGDYGNQSGGLPVFNSPGAGFLTGNSTGPLPLGTSRHTLVDNSITDPNVSISRVAPSANSTTAMRIGNSKNGCGFEMLSKQFNVTSSESLISFWYAGVYQDPNHPTESQPSFWVRVTDLTTNTELTGVVDLGNGANKIYSDASDPFFQTNASGSIAFRDWTCVQIDLSSVIGHNIELSFINEDCGFCGHYGYTYIDNVCGSCFGGPTGSIDFDLKSSDCGIGKICFDYSLPIDPNGNTGQLTVDLDIYQSGTFVTTMTSPVLTSGTSYCFNVDPSTISGLNSSLDGFDFIGTGNFSINGFALPDKVAGSLPNGQFLGLNNDYQISCGGCWLDEIKPNLDPDVIFTSGPSKPNWSVNNYIHIPNSTIITNDQLWQGKYYIPEGVIITVKDALLDLTNVDLIFGECAGIVFTGDATVRANNSVFRPCSENETWLGFIFRGSANGVVNESTFKNAQTALNFSDVKEANVRVVNNLFQNCRVGLFAQSTQFLDGISGNTFNMDRNAIDYMPECRSFDFVGIKAINDYQDDHWGILALETSFYGNISQNDFINAQEIKGDDKPKKFYGVSITAGSSANLSDNNFTDMYRSIEINKSRGIYLDNNEIEVNSYNYIGDTRSEHQININGSSEVYITGNELRYAFTEERKDIDWNTHSAIYLESSRMVSVRNNEIQGFESGVQVELSSNILVKENSLTDIGRNGIFIRGGSEIDVLCNTMNMEDDYSMDNSTPSVGIYYILLSEREGNIRISSNCIFEASTAMLMEGIRGKCNNLPWISNNFMYNYTGYGIDVRDLQGIVGSSGMAYDGGRNTFASNNLSSGAVDVRSTNCNVSLDGNYGIMVTAGNITLGNNEDYSTSSCGTQMPDNSTGLEDSYNETCDAQFYRNNPPVGLSVDGNPHLNDDIDDIFRETDVNSYAGHWFNLTKQNSSVTDELKEKLLSSPSADSKWIDYLYNFVKANYAEAKLSLDASAQSEDRKTLENVRISLAMSGVYLSEDPISISILKDIKQDREVYIEAQQMLQWAISGHDFPFKSIPTISKIANTNMNLLDGNRIITYPNPVKSVVTFDYHFKSEGEITCKIMDLSGKVLLEKSITNRYEKISMEVNGLRAGTYFIQILDSNGDKQIAKFIKI